MPQITIEIDEHQEAAIVAAIRDRHTFKIDGGLVVGDESPVRLKSIVFQFSDRPLASPPDGEVAGTAKPQSMLYEVCPNCDGKGGEILNSDIPCCKILGVVETGATARQLESLAKLDALRQEAGISAAMLRDGRARQMVELYAAKTPKKDR